MQIQVHAGETILLEKISDALYKVFQKFNLSHEDAKKLFGFELSDAEFRKLGILGSTVKGKYLISIYTMAAVLMDDILKMKK